MVCRSHALHSPRAGSQARKSAARSAATRAVAKAREDITGNWSGVRPRIAEVRAGKPQRRRRERAGKSGVLLFPLEDHADVVGRTGLEVDRRDTDELPAFVAKAV